MKRITDSISVLGLVAILVVVLAGIGAMAVIGRGERVEVITESQVKGIGLAVVSKSELEGFLAQAGFGRNGVIDLRQGGRGLIKIRKARIALTEKVERPIYQIQDKDGNLWDAVGVDYLAKDEVRIAVFRRDWREWHVNLLINDALWRMGVKTNKPFDQKLDEGEKGAINRQLFSVTRL